MIVAVCLNAAVDVTYEVDELTPGRTHRAVAVHERAGGKGTNVARVLHQLGGDVRLAGFAGGATGAAIRDDLARAGITDALTPIAGTSRRCVTVVDRRDATVVNEPGPVVSDTEWADLLGRAKAEWAGASVVVLSGSLPRGVPVDAYAQLCSIAGAHGSRVVLDAEGPALLAALPAGPDVAKPNAGEAGGSLGVAAETMDDLVALGSRLRGEGAGAAVLSRGADGLVAVGEGSVWRARGPVMTGNPTGAGDALAAALAQGLASGASWPEVLRDAVATSAAAVAAAVAGDVDLALRTRLRAAVDIEEI